MCVKIVFEFLLFFITEKLLKKKNNSMFILSNFRFLKNYFALKYKIKLLAIINKKNQET